jgi:chemotaxis signal transduction protein
MVEQIAQTHLGNCQHDLTARAQVAIDILVRNLFERTADVGFIATDAPLVHYVMAPNDRGSAKLHARLTEYRNKYTVYDDILVLDSTAQVLLSLKPRDNETTQAPSWWSQAMSNKGYVEVYGPSALFKGAAPVLLYAHCVVTPTGQVCGAVVLKFDLQSELLSIFKALQHQAITLLLLDESARVVASSDTASFSAGDALDLQQALQAEQSTLCYRGLDYLFAHCRSRGYQGYGGPGWTALALLRLDDAFDAAQTAPESDKPASTDIEIELDNAQLHHIISRARAIEQDLNRVIWNGKLQDSSAGAGAGSALGPIFAEIGRTSFQTISAFDGAIQELKSLLLLGRRAELASHAALAVDIMDRNLYERANDCRWWALSEEFAELLQELQDGPSEVATQRAAEILAHLNSLYTVYRRVALFDRQGHILAVSKDPHTLAPDAEIPATLLQNTLALRGTQAYAVSAMVPHALADDEATYLYCAPIRAPGQERPLGGIALAFNCGAELKAMMQDSLPAGALTVGVFLDQQGRVLASTDSTLAVGDCPGFVTGLMADASAASAPLCHWNGRTFLIGMANSKGYREFKTSDGYRDDVRSLLLTPIDASAQANLGIELPQNSLSSNGLSLHYGVVQCGRLLFALGSAHVIEAVSTTHMTAPAAASETVGLLKYNHNGQLVVLPVYDSCQLTGQPPIKDVSQAVAIVLRGLGQHLVLLVDRLIDVIECAALQEPPGGINPNAPWINGYIHDSQPHTEPVFALDLTAYLQHSQQVPFENERASSTVDMLC